MELFRELAIAFAMAVLAGWFLELLKPGKITIALLWTVSRAVPREIRQDHYEDWRVEVEVIRADPRRRRPFAAARFAFGQVPFVLHLVSAQRRLNKVLDPNRVTWLHVGLLILSLPAVPLPTVMLTLFRGFQLLVSGNTWGFTWLGIAVWQIAGATYIVRMASSQGIPVVLGTEARRRALRKR